MCAPRLEPRWEARLVEVDAVAAHWNAFSEQQLSLSLALGNCSVGAYDAVRPLTADERAQWQALLRAAALRFWLSRLWDLHLPRDASLLTAHDPSHFERVLRARIDAPWHPGAPTET